MEELKIDLDNLKIDESLFKDVKFYLTGQLNEKIPEILRLGGAEQSSYFSDFVTHLICGTDPDENDLNDANDVYEIPAVVENWVLLSAKLKKKLNVKSFKYESAKIFSGMIFSFSGIRDDIEALWGIVSYNGGKVKLNFDQTCTHLVTSDLKTPKFLKAESLDDKVKIVTIDWVLESVKNKVASPHDIFHPKLLTWPKPRESTAAITGFEQDETEAVSDIPDSESTQALLDRLKQRMPWNQPETPEKPKLPWTPTSTPAKLPQVSTPQSDVRKEISWNRPQLDASQPINPPTSQLTAQNQIRPPGAIPTSQNFSVQGQIQRPPQPRQYTGQLSFLNDIPPSQIIHAQPKIGQPNVLQNRMPVSSAQQNFNQNQQFLNQQQFNQQNFQQNQLQSPITQQQQQQFLAQQKQVIQRTQLHPQWRQQLVQQQINQSLGGQSGLGGQGLGNQGLGGQSSLGGQGLGNQGLGGQQLGNQSLSGQQLANQSLGNQGMTNQGLGNQGLTNQGIGNQQMANQGLGGQQLANQGLGGSQLANQGLGSQQLTNQGLENQQLSSQNLGGQQLGNQGIGNQQLANQGLGNQQLSNQGLGQQLTNQGLGGQQLANQSLSSQQLGNQGLGNQQLTNQGLGGQQLSNQNLASQQLGNQGLGGQQVTNQSLQNQQQGLGSQQLANQGLGNQGLPNQHLASQQMSNQLNNQGLGGQQISSQNLGGQLTNQNLGNQQLTNQELGNQQLANQGLGNQQLTNQGLGNQQLLNQRLANQLQNQGLGDQQLNQGLGGQQLANQGIRNQQMTNQGLGGQQLTNQGLGGQQLTNQGLGGQQLGNQGLGNQQLANQGLRGQQLTNQGIGNQQMTNQGLAGQQLPNQGLEGQQLGNQGLVRQQLLNQGLGGQQILSSQQLQQKIGNQQLLNQGIGNQQILNQQLANQGLGGQQLVNQGIGGQQLTSQGMGGQQLTNQGIGGQQLTNQGVGGQQLINKGLVSQQQLVNQINQQNQQVLGSPINNQQILNQQQMIINQQVGNNQQQIIGQQQVLNQPIGVQQITQQQLINQQMNQQPITIQQLQNQKQLQMQQLNINKQHIVTQQIIPNQHQSINSQLNPQQQIIQQQQLNQQGQIIQGQINPNQPNQQINQPHLVRHTSPQIGAPRLNWSPNPNQPQGVQPMRHYIQLDAQTHQQLQQMDPQQRSAFIAKLQKQRQLIMQRQQLLQQQQRGGHIVIQRGAMPQGLTPQQQVQWLQQQGAKSQTVVMQPQGVIPAQQNAPGLSPIQQNQPQQVIGEQNQQQIIQRQQHLQRLQQMQLQREQAQKQAMQNQVIQRPPLPAPTPQPVEQSNVGPPTEGQPPNSQLVVNNKTKTALANMLSNRLQSGGANIPTVLEGEPSAAGTLRMMTAQHNAQMNPQVRPQELIQIQQRRTLANITNGDMVRPPAPVQPTPAPAETPKQFSPGRAIPPQPQRHGPFYGHNPNLKLPPDLFLLGCIFVVVEVDRYLEETSPDWKQVIEKHGGEVEPVYCNRVTHVLCETQRHGVVMQALRDFKRCVTLYWLNDVVTRRQVVPPWLALHLPTGYMDGAPASRHLISLSGFHGPDRKRVVEMIKYTGAKYTNYFSRHNTVLVCGKAEGNKYQHAKKWNTPIVNVQWLTDLMLGNFSALSQIEHVKYQQFPQPVQFGFDTALVPNLMFAWKMPINISQESYERVKRSPPAVSLPPKPKKMKTESPPPDPVTTETPMDTTNAEIGSNYRILFSLCSHDNKKELETIVTQLGGSVATQLSQATHLVMPNLIRTMKLMSAITLGLTIVPEKWLRECQNEKKFISEASYKFDNILEFNEQYNCDFYKTLEFKNRDKIFSNKSFFITPSVFPSSKEIKQLIEMGGGIVEGKRRSLQHIDAVNTSVPCSYYIVTTENDLHLVNDCLRNSNQKYVSSCEIIFNAILTQEFNVEEFLVKVQHNSSST